MIALLIYLLKAVLCSGLLYGYYTMALRNRIFHQWNRLYLIATVLFSLLFPLLSLPAFYDSNTAENSIALQRLLVYEGEAIVVHSGKASVDWQTLVSAVYVLAACFMALRFAMGLWQIKTLLQRSPSKQLGAIKFVTTGHAQAPFSFFHWLFWKKDMPFDSAGGQSVFRHELVHIKEGHSLDKLLLQLVLIVFWMNPFFWIIRRELQMIHEFIADKKSLGNEGTEALAAMIMQSVYGTQYNHFINPFFQQPIKRRLTMLHKTLNQPQVSYLGRILALPLCVVLLFAFAKKERQKNDGAKHSFINKPVTDTIPADSIAAVDVNTKDAIKTITITYKNGKKETYTENEARDKGILAPPPPPPPLADGALVIIDGKEKGTVKELGGLDKLLKPEDIESINVWKDKSAIEKYGQRGKNGVIEIVTKKANKSVASRTMELKPRQDVNVVHAEVDKAPTFPGGVAAWRKFLQENLNAATPVDNGAPAGAHVVQVQFKVATDGTISEIEPASAVGYGMESEVVKLMQKSPKWLPAEINGYAVTTLHKQKVTFLVEKK